MTNERDDGLIPYDPAWWAEWSRACNRLTPEEIESMCSPPDAAALEAVKKSRNLFPVQGEIPG